MRRKMSVLAMILFMMVTTLFANEQDHPRRIIGYFTEWRPNDYTVHDIPWDKITHINYAFAQINAATNEVDFCDRVNAIEREIPGQDPALPYKGNFNLLTTYKKQYPDVKTLISIGGWAASGGFYTMAETAATRETFANSAVKFMMDYGFNGLDIDYEYPTATTTAGNPDDQALAEPRRTHLMADYIELLKLLRVKLDAQGELDGEHYLLTIAAPASFWILGGMELGEYAEYLDFINMMTYDFHGAWNEYVGHNAALMPDDRDTETQVLGTPVLNADWAFRYFRGKVPAGKINIGVPYYSRGFKNVTGGTNGLYGMAKSGTAGDGADGINNIWHDLDKSGLELPGGGNPIWHLKNLLRNTKEFSYQNHPIWGDFDSNYAGTYERFFDTVSKVPWIWNEEQKVFLSHEDEESIAEKVNFIIDNGVGGMMIWELAGDFKQNPNGEYVMGDTLTTIAYDMFKADGTPAETVMYPGIQLPTETLDFTVEMTGTYDHPNYYYEIYVTNNSDQTIPQGWTLDFNMPTTTSFPAKPWSVTSFEEIARDHDYVRYSMFIDAWGSELAPGAVYKIEGSSKLCFAGGPNAAVLNGKLSADFVTTPDNQAPTTPLNIAVTATTYNSATITWDASTDDVLVSSYNVIATPTNGNVVTQSTGINTINITGLEELTSYSIVVQAVDSSGNVSAVSTTVDVTTTQAPIDVTVPSIPANLSANNITDTTADISWDASADDIAVTGYNVYLNGTFVSTTNTTSYQAAALTKLTDYNATVSAFDAKGNQSLKSAILQFTTADVAPACSHTDYISGNTYNADAIVLYNNQHWIAGWWTTAVPGTTGEWGAWQVYDDCGTTTTPVDEVPTVSLSANATSYHEGDTIILTADATDNSGVKNVEFFNGSTSIGVVTAAPYIITLTAIGGSASFTAVVTDDVDQKVTSSAIAITVTSDTPTVEAWSPNVLYQVGDVVTYDGKTWMNNIEHTSNTAWYPGAAGLWFWDLQ